LKGRVKIPVSTKVACCRQEPGKKRSLEKRVLEEEINLGVWAKAR